MPAARAAATAARETGCKEPCPQEPAASNNSASNNTVQAHANSTQARTKARSKTKETRPWTAHEDAKLTLRFSEPLQPAQAQEQEGREFGPLG